ncbi:MAG TPA: hypothetical protein VJS44_08395 [Pyrinomonadaceae bacterium]|nr:hypothetical protein [Pyrinomonadaceae bacterium]
METVKIKLGESTTLKAQDVLKDKKSLAEKLKDMDCRWHVAGGAIVAVSDLEADDKLEVKAAQVGRSRISYGPVLAEQELGSRERFAASQPSNQVEFDVVVEEVRESAATAATSFDSRQAEELLPLDERQEEPSENTPYGMDQDSKPVAPTASMTAPDLSNVARASEDAEPETEGKSLRGKLPEDFPGQAALEAEGVGTYAQARKRVKDGTLTDIPGIGDATAAKIAEALGEGDES